MSQIVCTASKTHFLKLLHCKNLTLKVRNRKNLSEPKNLPSHPPTGSTINASGTSVKRNICFVPPDPCYSSIFVSQIVSITKGITLGALCMLNSLETPRSSGIAMQRIVCFVLFKKCVECIAGFAIDLICKCMLKTV